MTDRHAGYVVTLEQPIREDDAEPTLAAIRQIKGVLSVEPIINNGDLEVKEMVARSRARSWLFEQVYKAFPLFEKT